MKSIGAHKIMNGTGIPPIPEEKTKRKKKKCTSHNDHVKYISTVCH